jgi:hypothetical protein
VAMKGTIFYSLNRSGSRRFKVRRCEPFTKAHKINVRDP